MKIEHYKLNGMTCQGCKSSVTTLLEKLETVDKAIVDLDSSSVILHQSQPISIHDLRELLPTKYSINFAADKSSIMATNILDSENSKWLKLRPLFLIFLFIGVAATLLHLDTGDSLAMMLDFMGLFFVVFSFFKLLDLKGFARSFSMYDPLAKLIPSYGLFYPFIELALGLLILYRVNLYIPLSLTILLLGLTAFGVARTLLDKKEIQCACLGTALNLPMTEATIIENSVMILMSVYLLFVVV